MLNKIYSLDELKKKIDKLKKRGLSIGVCHGLFDLMHPGHINHLNLAKKSCDILIVTTTSDAFIKKNLISPIFPEDQRKYFLANLQMIDYVSIVQDETAEPVIKKIKPNFYFKGEEYKTNDNIGNLKKEKVFCKKNKVKIKFIGSKQYSSSKLISENLFLNQDQELIKNIKDLKKYNPEIEKILDKAKDKKILIIGEIIFDQYTFLLTHGLSPKSNNISGSITDDKVMAGGVLASAKFLSQFSKNVDCLSIVNDAAKKDLKRNKMLKGFKNIISSKDFPDIIKQRFVQIENNVYSQKKLLTVNKFFNTKINKKDENKILKFLSQNLKKYDLVVVQDFDHGLINNKIANYINKNSKILSLNSQTNSMNYGFNIINNKFKKVDMFSLDKTELELYAKSKNIDYQESLRKLKKDLKSKMGFLTLGPKYSLLAAKKIHRVNAIEKNIVDAVGAGDIFHSFASLLFLVSKNEFLNLFLSQIAGAIAVKILGNESFPKKNQIVNTFKFFLNT
jgi:cytidyltransferase-like protein